MFNSCTSTTAALAFLSLCSTGLAALTKEQIFARPLISRAYEQHTWTLRNLNGTGLRENATSVGHYLAELDPSYVSGLVYIQSDTTIEPVMVSDWDEIRRVVRDKNADAKFDVEISLSQKHNVFANASALVAKMEQVNKQLAPNGFWFDFYDEAPSDWIKCAIKYAHSQNQTIGGNLFTSKVIEGTDAISFVDKQVNGSEFGFDFNRSRIAELKKNANGAVLLGHLQSNPQNGASLDNECYVYTQVWNETRRFEYLQYWAANQCKESFTFMFPVFYPLYPGAVSWDPVTDKSAQGGSLYTHIKTLQGKDNGKTC